MRVRWANLSSLMVVGVLVLTMSAGCGLKRTGTLVDPGDEPAATPTPAPAASATPAPQPTTQPDVPGGGSTGGGTGLIMPLTARLQGVQTSGILFARRVIATVEVTNPGDRALNGTVTCTFGKGTDPDQKQTTTVQMMGRQTKTFTFEEKSWWDKDAKVEIKTDQPVTAQTGYQNYGY